jgi:hypothetical protein
MLQMNQGPANLPALFLCSAFELNHVARVGFDDETINLAGRVCRNRRLRR